ncbi:MAG: SMI1/KNR4 family protein [Kibdelosporangium sp.]
MTADFPALLSPLRPYELKGAVRPGDAELDQLESDLGGRLPSVYRRFLKECGGIGLTGGAVFPSPGTPGGRINAFYGLGGDSWWDVRARTFDTYAGRIPDETVPIGESEGDLVLIGFDGGRRGQVFTWFHELAQSPADIHKVADSFEGFLTILRPNPAYA